MVHVPIKKSSSKVVVVIGAGVAGCCAAIQAARCGADCILVEKNGICGGTLSVGGISCPGLFFAWGGEQVIGGIGWELVEETLNICNAPTPDFSKFKMEDFWHFQIPVNPVIFTALCERKMREAGVELHYHTMLASIRCENDNWEITLCGKDGLYGLRADMLIDCTGDANAIYQAGFPLSIPAECQPGTYSVRCSGYDLEQIDYEALKKAYLVAEERGEIFPGDLGWDSGFSNLFLMRYGENANHINGINGGDSSGKTRMEIAGRESLLRVYRFLKQNPGFEKLEIAYAGMECGVRESRTIIGEACVTAEDYRSGKIWPESIARAFYPMDLHDARRGIVKIDLPEGVVPTVPRGALIPRGSRRLLAAGRIVSSDRMANAALRIQAVCMATGQAAGALAALSAQNHCNPGELPYGILRRELLANHVVLPEQPYSEKEEFMESADCKKLSGHVCTKLETERAWND